MNHDKSGNIVHILERIPRAGGRQKNEWEKVTTTDWKPGCETAARAASLKTIVIVFLIIKRCSGADAQLIRLGGDHAPTLFHAGPEHLTHT
mgnify:CR=1 FL=1